MNERAAYEPLPVEHPGAILKEELKARDVTILELSNQTRFNHSAWVDVINQKAPITPEMTVELGNVLGTSSELWFNLQAQYDLSRPQTWP